MTRPQTVLPVAEGFSCSVRSLRGCLPGVAALEPRAGQGSWFLQPWSWKSCPRISLTGQQ